MTSNNANTAISVQDVKRSFGSVRALDGVSFDIAKNSICGLLGATTYISPPGAREYLETDGFKEQAAIKLEFDEFPASAYPQQGACGFVSHLSVLDVVANIVWKGLARYIAGGDNAGIDP